MFARTFEFVDIRDFGAGPSRVQRTLSVTHELGFSYFLLSKYVSRARNGDRLEPMKISFYLRYRAISDLPLVRV
jgi:hypothetical protein